MVGALSIVRFRTAIKDPMDIVFMFWAISVGILDGAGLYLVAFAGSVFIGLILFLFFRVPHIEKPYLLVVNLDDSQSEDEVYAIVKQGIEKYSVKSKSFSPGNIEVTLEFRVKDN